MPSGRCKATVLRSVWAVMVSNWSRLPHRVSTATTCGSCRIFEVCARHAIVTGRIAIEIDRRTGSIPHVRSTGRQRFLQARDSRRTREARPVSHSVEVAHRCGKRRCDLTTVGRLNVRHVLFARPAKAYSNRAGIAGVQLWLAVECVGVHCYRNRMMSNEPSGAGTPPSSRVTDSMKSDTNGSTSLR